MYTHILIYVFHYQYIFWVVTYLISFNYYIFNVFRSWYLSSQYVIFPPYIIWMSFYLFFFDTKPFNIMFAKNSKLTEIFHWMYSIFASPIITHKTNNSVSSNEKDILFTLISSLLLSILCLVDHLWVNDFFYQERLNQYQYFLMINIPCLPMILLILFVDGWRLECFQVWNVHTQNTSVRYVLPELWCMGKSEYHDQLNWTYVIFGLL